MENHGAYDEPAGGIEQIVVEVLPDGRMNRKATARYIGLSEQTLQIWAMRGVGPRPLKVGGRIFYRKSEVDRFISAGEAA